MRKIPKLRILSTLVVAVALVAGLTTPVMAQVFSPISGAVTIGGDLAPAGTTIAVFVGAEATPRATIVTTTLGYYETVLIGTDADVGQALTFFVDGEPALTDPDEPTFASFEPQEVDLVIAVEVDPPDDPDIPPVGGGAYPTSTLAIVGPWVALAAVVAGALVFARRRLTQS